MKNIPMETLFGLICLINLLTLTLGKTTPNWKINHKRRTELELKLIEAEAAAISRQIANQVKNYNLILYWTGYFNQEPLYREERFLRWTSDNFNLKAPQSCSKEYPNCRITSNRIYLNHSDALIFHWRDFNQFDLPPIRSANQLWTLYNLESPMHVSRLYTNNKKVLFNLTATYRQDSEIVEPYGIVIKRETPLPDSDSRLKVNLSLKSKPIAWFVSNCFTSSRREEYVGELSRYIEVDIYGQCGPYRCDKNGKIDCYQMAAQRYLFYLSFENSICKDYVTEKLFNILSYDLIPIVYGGANYSSILPPNSYIDASTMKPDQLAKLLINISGDQDKYRSYFAWRKYYLIQNNVYIDRVYCALCKLITPTQTNTSGNWSTDISYIQSHTSKEINSWFFDEKCKPVKSIYPLLNRFSSIIPTKKPHWQTIIFRQLII